MERPFENVKLKAGAALAQSNHAARLPVINGAKGYQHNQMFNAWVARSAALTLSHPMND